MIELTKIQTGKLFDFFESVYQGVAVNKELSRGFGYVKVIFKEALDCKEGFLIEAFYGAELENLL